MRFRGYVPKLQHHSCIEKTYFINDTELPSIAEKALDFLLTGNETVPGKSLIIPLGGNTTLTTAEVIDVLRINPNTTAYATSGNMYLKIEIGLRPGNN